MATKDDSVLQARLDNDERSLKRCLQTYTSWVASIPEQTSSNIEQTSEVLLAELKLYQQSMDRYAQLERTHQLELADLEAIRASYEQRIDTLKAELEDLRRQSADMITDKAKLQRCEQIVKEIQRYPARVVTQATIADMEKEMANLRAQQVTNYRLVQNLQQQFNAVVGDLHRITTLLDPEAATTTASSEAAGGQADAHQKTDMGRLTSQSETPTGVDITTESNDMVVDGSPAEHVIPGSDSQIVEEEEGALTDPDSGKYHPPTGLL